MVFLILLLLVGFGSANGTLTVNSPAGVTNGTSSVVTVTFTNDDSPHVNNFGFDIQYDNTKIQYVTYDATITAGVPLANSVSVSTPDATTVRVGWFSSAGSGDSNVTPGASTLARITFKAINPGTTSNLHFAGINFFDMDANPSTITPTDGTFSIAPEAPTVTGVAPISGTTAGGTSVVVTGTGFTTANNVKFGTTANATGAMTVDSDTQITVTSPAHAAGLIDITVTTPGGTSATGAADRFTFVAPPAVTLVSPTVGTTAGGTTVVVTGSGFTGANNVKFGLTANATGQMTVNSDTQITVTSPPGGAGTIDITVTTPIGTSPTLAADQFTYAVLPAVTLVSPKTGPIAGGTTVIITGTSFTGANNVKFGLTANATGQMTVNSDTQITVTSPAHAAGQIDITVTTPVGTSATGAADQFTFVALPAVTLVSPTSGTTAGGTSVVVTGTGFTGANNVKFGTTANVTGTMTVDSATQITVTSPAHVAGLIDITVTTPNGTSPTGAADRFTFVAPPAVTGVSPIVGTTAGGTSVVVTGSGFTGANNVMFGIVPNATGTMVVNNDGQITVTSPAQGAATIDITVTTPYGTSPTLAADHFTYSLPPAVTGVSPTSGSNTGGTTVIVTGSGFTGANNVKFGTTANATGAMVVNNDNQITVTSPAHAVGTIDITVTTPIGTSPTGAADQFTYITGVSVSFTSNYTAGRIAPTVILFTDTTTGSPTWWNWSFGDNTWFNTSNIAQSNPTHTYLTNGTFSAKLYANNTITSGSSSTQSIYIGYAPLASFTSSTTKVTAGGAGVTFTDTSRNLVNLYTAAQWFWVFGDGTTSAVQNPPAKSYANIGTYGVNLTVTDQLGTSTSSKQYIVAESTATTDTNPAMSAAVNLTGGTIELNISNMPGTSTSTLSGSDIIVHDSAWAGIANVKFHTSGVTNSSGNLTGTVTGVTVETDPKTVTIGGYNIPVVLNINAPSYTTGASATITVSTSDPTNQTNFNTAIGGGFNESLLVFDVTTTGFTGMTGAVINFSMPHSWTLRNPRTAVVWHHGDTFTQLPATIVGTYTDIVLFDIYHVTTSSFSGLVVVGAGAAPGPSPGPSGGGSEGGGSGDDYGGGAAAAGVVSSVQTGALVTAKEGQTLQTTTLSTAKDASVAASITVPLSTTVRGPDGLVINTISIQGINVADVPSVPDGATYSFAGLAITCSPDGATFSQAASLVFSMTPEQWNTALEKANGNTALMTVMYYDTKSASWVGVPTTVNPTTHTVTASITHFTVFGLFIDKTGTTPVVMETTTTPGEVPTTAMPTPQKTVAPVTTTPAAEVPGEGIPLPFIAGIIIVIIAIAGVGYYFFTKKQNL